MKWIGERGVAIGVGAFLLIIMLAGASILGFVQLNRWISHTNKVLFAIASIETAAERLETAGRGYALTGERAFVDTYQDGKAGLEARYRALHALVADNPEQWARASRSHELYRHRMQELDELAARVGSSGAVSKDLLHADSMLRLREVNLEFQHSEQALLAERESEANQLGAAAAVFMSLGAVLAVFCTLAGYRSMRASSREWKAAREAAIEASRLKSEFLATMSHEIRTPMNGVLGMATLLLKTPLSREQLSFVRTIKTSADALIGLINQILDHSKIEAGKLQLERQDFELKPVFGSVLELFRFQAQDKHIQLSLQFSSDLPAVVYGDPYRLRQILVNLVGNAIKFTDHGEVTVLARPGEDAFAIHVEIADTGSGIPQDQLSRLFQQFSQIHRPERGCLGSGLGLLISKELVEAMNGRIGVDSRVGEGSRFYFDVCMEPPRLEQSPISLKPQALPRLKGHVLVAEDQPINQAVISRFIESFGLKCTVVSNGRQAVQAVADTKVDLVLMDCHMPELDGYGATTMIRRTEQGRQLPILALTAEGLLREQRRCLAIGMNDVIVKPVEIERLHRILERYLPPQPTTEFEERAVLQLQGFRSGDRPLLQVLIEQFYSDSTHGFKDLEDAFKCGELKRVNFLAHGLKSSARAIGLRHFSQLCEQLESADHLEAQRLDDLRSAYARGRDWLERFV